MPFDVLAEIEQADEITIEKLLTAVLQRYAVLFPDWEINTLSLQKSSDKNQQLDRIISTLHAMKTSS